METVTDRLRDLLQGTGFIERNWAITRQARNPIGQSIKKSRLETLAGADFIVDKQNFSFLREISILFIMSFNRLNQAHPDYFG